MDHFVLQLPTSSIFGFINIAVWIVIPEISKNDGDLFTF